MAKFVKNPSGTVHSVPDEFQLPGTEPDFDGWSEVTEAEAPAALLGQTDTEVAAVELHDLSDHVVIDESGPAHEPGQPDERASNDIQPAGVEATLAEGEHVIAGEEVAK